MPALPRNNSDSPPMWLTEVKIERFKAAFSPDPVRLTPFTVLIGRNGSGKSTLLEALQWLDTTIRHDARQASDRYFGAADLVNLRAKNQYFQLILKWGESGRAPRWRYTARVANDNGVARVESEELALLSRTGRMVRPYINTEAGTRWVNPRGDRASPARFPVREADRLAAMRASELAAGAAESPAFLATFWQRAVFLRLSPNRLAFRSPATRKSFEPILDEEGQTLPALLNELSADQKADLVSNIQEILPGIQDVDVSKSETGRDTRVHYSLKERMPYVGRGGQKEFPIPAWMLSEGTRRITAIMALLLREPRPSLVCIEEVDNGLDPITVRAVLRHLQSSADSGTQVILTTHSPWLLDHVPIESIIQVLRLKGDTQYLRFADRPEIQAFKPSVPAGTRYVQEAETPEDG